MADVLKEFLVSIGFAADESAAKKVEATIAKTEAGITATQAAETAKRTTTEEKHSEARVTIAEALSRLLTLEEGKLSDARDKARKQDTERDQKVADEQAKKAQLRREAAIKSMQAGALNLAAFAAKAILTVEGIALGVVVAADRAAKGFENLYYRAQSSGGTVTGINAIEYAISQLGGSTAAAAQSYDAFKDKLKENPQGTIQYLKSIGVQTQDVQGHLLTTDKIYQNLLVTLAKKPTREAMNEASFLGTDESTRMAGARPGFIDRVHEYEKTQGSVGANPDDAAQSGTKFEQSMRGLLSVIDAIKTKVSAGIFKQLTPELDMLATWAQTNGGKVADIISRIAEDIIKLANAILEKLAAVDWDTILTKVETFAKGFDKAISGTFGDGGVAIAALAFFAVAVGSKVLGPLRAVISTIGALTSLPLVGKLLSGGLGLGEGVGGAAATAGGLAAALPLAGTLAVGAVLASGDPNKALLSGGTPDMGPGDQSLGLPGLEHEDLPENKQGKPTASDIKDRANSFWSWVKDSAKKIGFGDKLHGDDPRVRDAILSTAEATKKLAEKADKAELENGSGGGSGSGVGETTGGAPNLRYGHVPATGAPRTTPGRHSGGRSDGDHGVAGPPGVDYNAKSAQEQMGISKGEWDAFREGVTDIEGKRYDRMGGGGGRYAGRYQMGPAEITATAARLGVARPTNAQFLADPAMQERFFESYTMDHRRSLMHDPKFAAMSPREQLKILGYAHNQGAGSPANGRRGANGAWGYLENGRAGHDGFGTSGAAYPLKIQHRFDQLDHAGPTATAPIPAGTPTAAVTDAEVFAARQRIIAGGHDPKDVALRDRYLKERNTPKAAGGGDKPLKVEVTDASATKIGKASTYPAGVVPHGANPLADLKRSIFDGALKKQEDEKRAKMIAGIQRHASLNPQLGHPLGVTPALRASIDNSRNRSAHLEKHETFHIHGGDPRTMMAEAKRVAGRGNADLLRNLQTSEV